MPLFQWRGSDPSVSSTYPAGAARSQWRSSYWRLSSQSHWPAAFRGTAKKRKTRVDYNDVPVNWIAWSNLISSDSEAKQVQPWLVRLIGKRLLPCWLKENPTSIDSKPLNNSTRRQLQGKSLASVAFLFMVTVWLLYRTGHQIRWITGLISTCCILILHFSGHIAVFPGSELDF